MDCHPAIPKPPLLITIITYVVQVSICARNKVGPNTSPSEWVVIDLSWSWRSHFQYMGVWPQLWGVEHETIHKKLVFCCWMWCLRMGPLRALVIHSAENGREIFDEMTELTHMEMPCLLWKAINCYWLKLDFLLLTAKNILEAFRRQSRSTTENTLTGLFTNTIHNLKAKSGFFIFSVSRL